MHMLAATTSPSILQMGPYYVLPTMLVSSNVINIIQTKRLVATSMKNKSSSFINDDEIPTLEEVKSMKRKDLVNLYLSSSSSSLNKNKRKTIEDFLCSTNTGRKSQGDGKWNGYLLDNNGWIMTSVASFMTQSLFSISHKNNNNNMFSLLQRRRKNSWQGKQFILPSEELKSQKKKKKSANDDSNLSSTVFVGVNRFLSSSSSSEDNDTNSSPNPSQYYYTQHQFVYSIKASKLDGRPSIVLDYSKRNSWLSPWKTMVDELREVEVIVTDDDDKKNFMKKRKSKKISVLLGMGSIGWSGGLLNCAPFILVREK